MIHPLTSRRPQKSRSFTCGASLAWWNTSSTAVHEIQDGLKKSDNLKESLNPQTTFMRKNLERSLNKKATIRGSILEGLVNLVRFCLVNHGIDSIDQPITVTLASPMIVFQNRGCGSSGQTTSQSRDLISSWHTFLACLDLIQSFAI